MRDIILVAIVAVAAILALKRPYVGLLATTWLGYMNPHKLAWGFARNLPLVEVTVFATVLGIIIARERIRIPYSPLVVLILLFVVWVTISSSVGLVEQLRWGEWQRFVKIQIVIFMTLSLMNTRERVNWMVWVIALSVGFFGIKGGIFTIMTGGQFRVWGPPHSFIGGNNEIALALVMIIPLFWYLRLVATNKWIKRALLVSIMLCAASVISSYSRGAFLAITMMTMFLWWKSRKKLGLAVLIILAIPILLYFMPEKWFTRMESIEVYEQDTSAMGRVNAWWFAWNLAGDRPLTGGGFGVFNKQLFAVYAPVPEDVHDAHSIYFEVLGEQGFVGLTLFLSLMTLTFMTAGKVRRKFAKDAEMMWASQLMGMIQVSLVGYATGGAFLGLAYWDLPYHLVAITVVVSDLVKRQAAERTTSSPRGGLARGSSGKG